MPRLLINKHWSTLKKLIALKAAIPEKPKYQEYDYIRTYGYRARIDTGIPGNDDSLIMEFDYMPNSKVNYLGNFGNYADENTRCWRLIQSTSTYPTYYIFSAGTRKAGAGSSIIGAAETIAGTKTHFRFSWGKCETTYEGGTQTVTETPDGTEAVSDKNICIGATHTGQTGATATARFYGHFKIWRGETLVRDYVPVLRLSDNKAGFYDNVNQTFNPSIGEEEFIVGNDE